MTVTYPAGGRSNVADLYEPNQPVGASSVLVPGFMPYGKDDQRVIELASSFARARFIVLVPDLQGSREMRIHLDDAQAIAHAAAYLAELQPHALCGRLGGGAISYAVGLAVLATMQPEARDTIQLP
jgi:hypothetical protein